MKREEVVVFNLVRRYAEPKYGYRLLELNFDAIARACRLTFNQPGGPTHQVRWYILEISSPGLDRKLIRPADFERFVGRLARISTLEPVENAKFFEGRLAGYADGMVQIEVKGRVIALPLGGIRKANLVVEF